VRRGLKVLSLNRRIESSLHRKLDLERGIAVGVFWFVILVTLVGVFNALSLHTVCGSIQQMVDQVLGYLPRVLAALLLGLIAWSIATLSQGLVNRALAATRLDDKLSEQAGMEPMSKNVAGALFWLVLLMFLPAIVGTLVFIIVFFPALIAAFEAVGIEAANRLGLTQVADAGHTFALFAGDVLVGGLILVVGFWLAGVAYSAIRQRSSELSGLMAQVARVAIIALVMAMGLRAMGFAFTFGAVAVALSFGLGGREAAGRQLEYWFSRLRKPDPQPPGRVGPG
jgi:hypothetical protein